MKKLLILLPLVAALACLASYTPNAASVGGVYNATNLTASVAETPVYTNTEGREVWGLLTIKPNVITASTVGTITLTVKATNNSGAISPYVPVSLVTTAATGLINIAPYFVAISNTCGVTVTATVVQTTGTAHYDLAASFVRLGP